MIDVSQWRASIGLWHYCQAASSRPANGRQCHSFKGAIDSKSKKTTKLPAAIPIIALLLLFTHDEAQLSNRYSKDLVYICVLYITVEDEQEYENVVTFSSVQAHSPNACDLLIIFIVLFI